MQDQLDALNDGASTVSLREYTDILRRRRMTVFQVFLLVLVAGIIVTLVSPPTYKATARLLVEAPTFGLTSLDANNPLSELYRPNQMYSVGTQVELLQGTELKKEVQKKIDGPLPLIAVDQVAGTQIIAVSAEGDNAERVARTPNELLKLYVDTVSDKAGNDLTGALTKVSNGLRVETRNVQRIEGELERFKQQKGVLDLTSNSKLEQGQSECTGNRTGRKPNRRPFQ